jgi:hypothetical protein
MPTYPSTGSQAGWGPPNTFQIDPTLSLFGLRVPPEADGGTFAWPNSSFAFPSGTTFPDDDNDGNPGITATPLEGNGYVDPPTGVGISGSYPEANLIYLALRTDLALSGAWTSCSDLSGNATVTQLDDHVIGCHISGGSNCTANAANTQADFVDQNRAVYVPGSSTFTAKVLPTGAACSDVLSALP